VHAISATYCKKTHTHTVWQTVLHHAVQGSIRREMQFISYWFTRRIDVYHTILGISELVWYVPYFMH